jgi:hypothetical protein
MPTIPAFMLKQMYVKGSLHNQADGFSLTVRNHLAPGTLVGVGLAVDGTLLDPAAITVVVGDTRTPAPAVTADTPLPFPTNMPLSLEIVGAPLAPGAHTLALQAQTREIGAVTIEVKDSIA